MRKSFWFQVAAVALSMLLSRAPVRAQGGDEGGGYYNVPGMSCGEVASIISQYGGYWEVIWVQRFDSAIIRGYAAYFPGVGTWFYGTCWD